MPSDPPVVLVTQRVDVWPDRAGRNDSLDQAWPVLLAAAGFVVVPVPNVGSDVSTLFARLRPSAVLLTGGGDLREVSPGADASARDDVEADLLDAAAEHRLPVLGVCRGFQRINAHLGGSLSRATGHVAVTHDLTSAGGEPWGTVNSYHDWSIAREDVAAQLTPVLTAPDGSIEAAVHKELRWTGIMWHPERTIAEPGRHAALVQNALWGLDAFL